MSTQTPSPSMDPRHANVWLAAGAFLLFASQVRFGIAPLAWVAPAPLLRYLRLTAGWRSRVVFAVAVLVSMHATVAKIITEPLTYAFVPLFAVPMALGAIAVLLAADWLRRHAGESANVAGFASLVAISEWLTYAGGQLGTWGGLANSQASDLPLMQLLALVGTPGVAFLMSWAAALLESATAGSLPHRLRHGMIFVTVLVLVYAHGVFRLEGRQSGPEMRVAGVVSELMADGVLPDDDTRKTGTDALFQRTLRAAEMGAQLVVWNEAATFVTSEEETEFIGRGTAIARERGIELVLAYATMVRRDPLFYENKYVWLRADGSRAETYLKHFPVPGEPVVRGTEPLRLAGSRLGPLAGAICYDFDFPQLARVHAANGVGLAVVPSSDWRGIDPLHPEIAKLRGIEGGFSVLRPVRGATSLATDAFGRPRATLDFFADNDRILLAQVPIMPVSTLYSRIGDVFVLGVGVYVLVVGVAAFLHWRRVRGEKR